MRHRRVEQGLQAALTLVLLALAVAPPVSAGCTESPPLFDLDLPDGQDSAECRFEIEAPDWEWWMERDEQGEELGSYSIEQDGLTLNVRGSGVLQVEIRFEGAGLEAYPGALQLIVRESNVTGLADEFSTFVVDPDPETYSFTYAVEAETLLAHIRSFRAQVSTSTEAAIQRLDERWDVELVMTARRIHGCWMSAWVTGDVPATRHFTGDLAYFLASESSVKQGAMAGSLADTELHEMADGIGNIGMTRDEALDLAVSMGLMSAEERNEMGRGDVDEQPQNESGETFSSWARQALGPGAGEEGDDFGLSLADLKMDQTPKTYQRAISMFSGAFTLTLSGKAQPVYNPTAGALPIGVRPSSVTAAVGLLEGSGRIPFEMIEEQGFNGGFQTLEDNPDVVIGAIWGPLETESVYTLEGIASSPRKLKINLVAQFVALRGSLSCGR